MHFEQQLADVINAGYACTNSRQGGNSVVGSAHVKRSWSDGMKNRKKMKQQPAGPEPGIERPGKQARDDTTQDSRGSKNGKEKPDLPAAPDSGCKKCKEKPNPPAAPGSGHKNMTSLELPPGVSMKEVDEIWIVMHRDRDVTEPVLLSCTLEVVDPPSRLELKKATRAGLVHARELPSKTNVHLAKNELNNKPSSSKVPLQAIAHTD
ncbi:hypothetical protein EWM64_g5240 [Hericium alpestre]|uniref:Uncharacterized protein n=1 Tax=Hericium alpestre TaxID=135208 RepID=A0A4Y9ZZB7_9AGAM|nr:hypothetical protein EWM64_g5240 [Hericium alpestre]